VERNKPNTEIEISHALTWVKAKKVNVIGIEKRIMITRDWKREGVIEVG
jgi:hypothetical protein